MGTRGSALVLSSHSFFEKLKLGMHYLAEGLAAQGFETSYVTCPSTPLDLIGSERRRRLSRLLRGAAKGLRVGDNLTEYTFPALFNPTKRVLRARWQLATYRPLIPARLASRDFDVCVFDVTPTAVYLPHITAGQTIFRINDPLQWQSPLVREIMDQCLTGERPCTLCAVSESIADWVRGRHPDRTVSVIPNGVDLDAYRRTDAPATTGKRAVFIGWVGEWVDLGLLENTATLLPDWEIDVYGTSRSPLGFAAPNLRHRGSVPHHELPELLRGYSVGLIPFRESDGDLHFLERPLKFFEYLAAGLGVASTRAGSLERGMTGWAEFGDTPEAFARAIKAARDSDTPSATERDVFLQRASWPEVTRDFIALCG